MLRTAHDVPVAAGPWPVPFRAAVARPTAAVPAVDHVLAFADRYRWWLWAFVAACYAAAFNGQWRVQPDAALYLSIGRNLAEGHGYTFLGQTNQLAYPGWPLLIGGTFKLFGSASMVPIHLLMLAIAAGTLAATYRLFLLHAGRPTAVVVTVGVAVTKSFFVYALELWSDLPFAMAAMALLAGYEGAMVRRPGRRSRWYDWALLGGGLVLAVATRPTGWPLLAAVALAVGVDAVRGRVRWGTLAAGAGVVLAVAVVWVAVDPRRHAGTVGGTYEQFLLHRLAGDVGPLDRTLGQRIYGLFTQAASDVLFQVRFGDVANSCLSAVVLAIGFGLFRARPLWGLWFALLLATVLLMVQETLDRYFLPVLPLLVYGWWAALAWVDRRPVRPGWPRLAVDGLVLLLLGFGTIVNITKVGGLIGQQRTRPFLASYDRGHYQPVPALADAIAQRVGDDAVVLVKPPYGRVTAFLSRRTVVNAAEARLMSLAGRPVFVVEPTDAAVRSLLDDAGLAEGPAVYAVPSPPAASGKAESLSLHTTSARRSP